MPYCGCTGSLAVSCGSLEGGTHFVFLSSLITPIEPKY